jgi:hypothetical protein
MSSIVLTGSDGRLLRVIPQVAILTFISMLADFTTKVCSIAGITRGG